MFIATGLGEVHLKYFAMFWKYFAWNYLKAGATEWVKTAVVTAVIKAVVTMALTLVVTAIITAGSCYNGCYGSNNNGCYWPVHPHPQTPQKTGSSCAWPDL